MPFATEILPVSLEAALALSFAAHLLTFRVAFVAAGAATMAATTGCGADPEPLSAQPD